MKGVTVDNVAKHVYVPMLLSDSIRPQLAPQIEAKVLADIKNTSGHTLLDKADIQLVSEQPAILVAHGNKTILLKTAYTFVKNNVLVNLLQYDAEKATYKFRHFLNSFQDMVYRKFFATHMPEKSLFDVIWKKEHVFVIFDSNDIDKAGLNLPLDSDLIRKLQGMGWKNIGVWVQEEGYLELYYYKLRGLSHRIRL